MSQIRNLGFSPVLQRCQACWSLSTSFQWRTQTLSHCFLQCLIIENVLPRLELHQKKRGKKENEKTRLHFYWSRIWQQARDYRDPPTGREQHNSLEPCFFRYNLKIGFRALGTVPACYCGECSFTRETTGMLQTTTTHLRLKEPSPNIAEYRQEQLFGKNKDNLRSAMVLG